MKFYKILNFLSVTFLFALVGYGQCFASTVITDSTPAGEVCVNGEEETVQQGIAGGDELSGVIGPTRTVCSCAPVSGYVVTRSSCVYIRKDCKGTCMYSALNTSEIYFDFCVLVKIRRVR